MFELLPPWPLLSTYLAATFVLSITPGPGVFYIVTRSLIQGRRSGILSVAGIALGNLGNAFAASLGLASLFLISSAAFRLVKIAGALYLIYLGIRLLTAAPPEKDEENTSATPSSKRVFCDGFLVALLNPKTTIFFAAMLPQFIDHTVPAFPQCMALATLSISVAALTDSLYALSAGSIAALLFKSRGTLKTGRYIGGGAYVGLGLFTALTGNRIAK